MSNPRLLREFLDTDEVDIQIEGSSATQSDAVQSKCVNESYRASDVSIRVHNKNIKQNALRHILSLDVDCDEHKRQRQKYKALFHPEIKLNLSTTRQERQSLVDEKGMKRGPENGLLDYSKGKVFRSEALSVQNSNNDSNVNIANRDQSVSCYICKKLQDSRSVTHINTTKPSTRDELYVSCLSLFNDSEGVRTKIIFFPISLCEDCHISISQQWDHFQREKTAQRNRHYISPNRCNKISNDVESVCVFCGSNFFLNITKSLKDSKEDNDSSINKMFIMRNLRENKLNFLDKERHKNKLIKKSKKMGVIVKKTKYNGDYSFSRRIEVHCFACYETLFTSNFKWLSLTSEQIKPGEMYFPFFKYSLRIKKKNPVLRDKKILVCRRCFIHFQQQWKSYEKQQMPLEHRHFSRRELPLKVNYVNQSQSFFKYSISDFQAQEEKVIPLGEKFLSSCEINSFIKALEMPLKPDFGENCLTPITLQMPLNLSIICFLCNFYSKPGETYCLKSKRNNFEPHFPFLSKHVSSNPGAALNDETFLVCFCCFHTLVTQWRRYELVNVDESARLYNTFTYVCFVCSVKLYREGVCTLSIKEFPFLINNHEPPSEAMVVNYGSSVIVCKNCCRSFSEQNEDLKRLRVPIDKRTFSWVKEQSSSEVFGSYLQTKKPFIAKPIVKILYGKDRLKKVEQISKHQSEQDDSSTLPSLDDESKHTTLKKGRLSGAKRNMPIKLFLKRKGSLDEAI